MVIKVGPKIPITDEIKITEIIPWFNPKSLSGLVCQKEGTFHNAGTGNGRMRAYVQDDGPYLFSIESRDKKPMKLYLTDKNGENPIELCDNTKLFGTGNKKVIELTKGDYYLIVVTEGNWSFSHKYQNSK